MADSATIKIEGDNKPLKASLGESQKMFSEWGVAIKTSVVQLGVQAAQALQQGLTSGIQSSIDAAVEAEAVMHKLDASLRALGDSAARSRGEIEELTDELVGKTWFDDETITQAQTALLRFSNVTHDTFTRAQKDAADWASAMGEDLIPVTEKLGRALNDPIAASRLLKEAGIVLTDSQEELIKSMVEAGDIAGAQSIILTELEQRFLGTAEAMMGTAEGGSKELTKSIGELQEAIGVMLLPVLTAITPVLKDIADLITAEVVPAFAMWIDSIRGVNSEGSKIPKWADAAANSVEEADIEAEQWWLDNTGVSTWQWMNSQTDEVMEKRAKQQRELDRRRKNLTLNADTVNDINRKDDNEAKKKADARLQKQADEDAARAEKNKADKLKTEQFGDQQAREASDKARRDKMKKDKPVGMIVMDEPPPNWWEVLGGAIVKDAAKREFKDEGFTASIEDALGLNARITAAAGSIPPEIVRLDKLIEQGNIAIKNAEVNAKAILTPLQELAKKTFGLG